MANANSETQVHLVTDEEIIGCFLIGAEGDTCVVCGASLQAAGGNATAHHYSASILTVIAWTCGDTCADRYEASRQP